MAGSDFGKSATFKLPLAAGLDSGVATQVVGPSNAVVIGKLKYLTELAVYVKISKAEIKQNLFGFIYIHAEAQGDGSAGAGPVPVAGPNFGSGATFYLPTGTGEAGTVVVGKSKLL